jgi:peroxiredoxin
LLVAMKSPAYTGPATPGAQVPAFVAKLADGNPFTQKDLQRGTPTVLLFYRGHW